jgi:glycosyltransferase involved in cell wall biosynthesis
MKKIFFSIITPTYNRVKSGYLEACIESVGQQKSGNYEYEHIFIDDESTDNTKEFINSYIAKDKRIKYFSQKNSGPAKAIQHGIREASGDYVIVMDDDDMLSDNSLYLRSQYIEKNRSIDWFYGLAEWVDDYGFPTNELFQSKFYEDHFYERLLITNFINAGTPTVSTDSIRNVYWPEWINRSQDYFLWLELARPEKNNKVGFINEPLLKYRYHSNNYSAGLDDEEKKRKKEELNAKIKSLHPDSLSFLAKEAYIWLDEAHKTNKYWKAQYENNIGPLENKIKILEDRLNSYHLSRIINPVIELRNKKQYYQATAKSLPKRVYRKTKRSLSSKTDNTKYLFIDKEKNKEKTPLISIVTPFFNRKDTMPETIRSVMGQTFQNFEYIIVNDGSTLPESDEYIKKIKHPKIKVINQVNSGVASARNNGIKHARGKYIMCLDSDDIIDPTFVEKAVLALESDPEISLVTFDTKMFGVLQDYYFYRDYDPKILLEDNFIITASIFKKEAWEVAGGYKNEIGYEDWEFWVNITENGYFGKHIPEALFNYRTAQNSRYIDDMETHHEHASYIKESHPDYQKNVQRIIKQRDGVKHLFKPEESFLNINNRNEYLLPENDKQNILVAVPWMTFGGAETLIYNFCKEIKNDYNLSFVTGIKDSHEWEYKFKEITSNIYHLPNIYNDEKMYIEFISNYIKTRSIHILHVIHTSYVFDMMPELKKRHPDLKIIVTVFNDVAHFNESLEASNYVDIYTSDNDKVYKKYVSKLQDKGSKNKVVVIPNGINSKTVFSLRNFDRDLQRKELGLKEDDLAVLFVGRLSEEKNPNVFIDSAIKVLDKDRKANYKFFIIGDGQMREELQKQIASYGGSKIKYLGYQSNVAQFLSAADVFVLPSSTEGFPLSILEAMAMNLAVVASNVGAVSDIIETGRDGFVVSPGSVDEISKTIELLKNDAKLLKSIKENSRKKIEKKYSNTILGDNYNKLYNSL